MNTWRERPFAKVKCPVEVAGMSTGLCLTCYATGDADTFFISVPARTRCFIGKSINTGTVLHSDVPVPLEGSCAQ